jgi:hypothetical protein
LPSSCDDNAVASGERKTACEPHKPAITAKGYAITFTLSPNSPTVGEPFKMAIQVCDPDNTPYTGPLLVDADMPAHRHGMNYKPSVRETGPGAFLAEGFLLHMPGAWRFRFRLQGEAGPVRFAVEHMQP